MEEVSITSFSSLCDPADVQVLQCHSSTDSTIPSRTVVLSCSSSLMYQWHHTAVKFCSPDFLFYFVNSLSFSHSLACYLPDSYWFPPDQLRPHARLLLSSAWLFLPIMHHSHSSEAAIVFVGLIDLWFLPPFAVIFGFCFIARFFFSFCCGADWLCSIKLSIADRVRVPGLTIEQADETFPWQQHNRRAVVSVPLDWNYVHRCSEWICIYIEMHMCGKCRSGRKNVINVLESKQNQPILQCTTYKCKYFQCRNHRKVC